jgi:hypothetical protein
VPRLATVLALLATLVAASPAAAQWSDPFDVSPPAFGDLPQLALGPAGAATAVWWGNDAAGFSVVQARRIDASGALGPVVDVSAPGEGSEPRVAVDASGDATVVLPGDAGSDSIIRARRIDASGALGPVIDVSSTAMGADGFWPQVAVDADGNATVVWARHLASEYVVQARRLEADGTLGPIHDLSAAADLIGDIAIAADPAGDAFMVWSWFDGPGGHIQARRLRSDGTLSATADITDPGDGGNRAQVALDAAGLPAIAWEHGDGRIQARRGVAGMGLSPVIDLTGPGVDGDQPRLALDSSGDAAVVWSGWDGSEQQVTLRRLTAAAELEDALPVGPGEEPAVAVDPAGAATVLWRRDGATGNQWIQARSVARDGGLGPVDDLSPDDGAEVLDPRVAVDAGGTALAVWTYYADPDYRIAGARYTPPPSPPSDPLQPPAAPPPPAAPHGPGCETISPRRLSSLTSGQPRRRRAKGVGTRLTLSGGGRLDLMSATLTYRLRGRRRSAKLRTKDLSADPRETLRFKLPRALARKLPLGRRVTLKLKARARSSGCSYGKAKTLTVRTRLIWVSKASAI